MFLPFKLSLGTVGRKLRTGFAGVVATTSAGFVGNRAGESAWAGVAANSLNLVKIGVSTMPAVVDALTGSGRRVAEAVLTGSLAIGAADLSGSGLRRVILTGLGAGDLTGSATAEGTGRAGLTTEWRVFASSDSSATS